MSLTIVLIRQRVKYSRAYPATAHSLVEILDRCHVYTYYAVYKI